MVWSAHTYVSQGWCLLLLFGIMLLLAQVGMCSSLPRSVDAYDVVWKSRSKDSSGSMPIGNGDIGLNVWVGQDGDLMLLLSKTDAWDENCRLVKIGRIRVKLSPNPFLDDEQFLQALQLQDGEIEIRGGKANSSVLLRVWVDAQRPVVWVAIDGDQDVGVRAELELWRTREHKLVGAEAESAYGMNNCPGSTNPDPVIAYPDTIRPADPGADRVVWYHRNPVSIWKKTLDLQGLSRLIEQGKDPLLNRTFGGLMQGRGFVSESSSVIKSSTPRKHHLVSICVHTSQTDTAEEWLSQVVKLAGSASGANIDKARAAHRKWWNGFWNRSWIRVVSRDGSERNISKGYTLQRFMNACSGRGAYPIKYNGSIFSYGAGTELGPDDPDYRTWGGPYWFQNTRLAYWPMLEAGDYDLARPLFKMFGDALPLARLRTRTYFGHEGAFFPETMYFWGTYTNMNYYYDRTGKAVSWVGEGAIRLHYNGNLELLAYMLGYYAHTLDKKFLVGELLPLADELLSFWDKHYKRDENGKIRMEPAQALEAYHDLTNPTNDVAGLHRVLGDLLNIPDDVLGSQRKQNWSRLFSELPPIPIGNEDGKSFLLVAEKGAGATRPSENPDLYPIFPYRLFCVGTPGLEVGRLSYSRRATRGNRGWYQDDIDAACLGLAREAKGLVAERLSTFNSGCRFPAFWGPNFDWLPDQDHGGVGMQALQMMLIQSDGAKVFVFPAWPRDWDVDFKLHAPMNTTIEGIYRNGKLEKLEITPRSRRKDVVVMDPA